MLQFEQRLSRDPHNSEFVWLRIGDLPLTCSATGKASAVISAFQQSCPRTCALRAWVPQCSGAVKGAPERHVRVAKPYDSPSALRQGANNRQKGALCTFPPAEGDILCLQ